MDKKQLTSRERMLLTMEHRETDYTPCSFMIFSALKRRYRDDWKAFIDAQLDMGLDAVAVMPRLLCAVHPDVKITEWKEHPANSPYPVLHKKYDTPAGVVKTEVNQTRDWPHGDHIEMCSDHNVPRSIKYHVSAREDLKSFRYMMLPPTAEQIRVFREESAGIRKYAAEKGILVQGEMGVLIDFMIRFSGVENLVFMAMEDPDYFEEYLSMFWNWTMQRMEVVLDERPDLYVRRGWYENMSFWSPDMYRRFIKPYLIKEAIWARQAGVKFGYINTCAYMQIIDDFMDIGIDALIGVDPVQDHQLDMALLKQKIGNDICLWGGGNGFVTIEKGGEAAIRREVNDAFDILAPGGGFILSPVDNVTISTDEVFGKVDIFIDAWKKRRCVN